MGWNETALIPTFSEAMILATRRAWRVWSNLDNRAIKESYAPFFANPFARDLRVCKVSSSAVRSEVMKLNVNLVLKKPSRQRLVRRRRTAEKLPERPAALIRSS